MLPARRGARAKQSGDRRLAGAGCALHQRAGATLEAAADQGVQPGEAALQALAARFGAVLGGDQARIDLQPAATDRVVVVATAKVAAAVLRDAEPPARRAKRRHRML